MNVLIVGGTQFLGRWLVEAVQERGHTLTLFNRGRSNPGLFPNVETLKGDRDGGLDVLRGRCWDAVIDTCGYVPRVVGASTKLLADAVGHYTFVSSASVYADLSRVGITEEAAVGRMADEGVEEVAGETYGPLKALCEHAVREALRERSLIVRPGLIAGPFDPTDRFTYWPARAARGGAILAPEPRNAPVQFIDARDLSSWVVRMAEGEQSGTFNAAGPAEPQTMESFLTSCLAHGSAHSELVWASLEFLATNGVQRWTEMPLTLPDSHIGLNALDCSRAIAAGLRFRPLEETLEDVLQWQNTLSRRRRWKAGLNEREEELVAAWRARGSG